MSKFTGGVFGEVSRDFFCFCHFTCNVPSVLFIIKSRCERKKILKMTKDNLQWHPAFFAGMQIEFEKEADMLLFENEHSLGTKPK